MALLQFRLPGIEGACPEVETQKDRACPELGRLSAQRLVSCAASTSPTSKRAFDKRLPVFAVVHRCVEGAAIQ